MRRVLFLFLVLPLFLAACEGARNNSSWSKAEKDDEIKPSLKTTTHPEAATMDSTSADSSEAKH